MALEIAHGNMVLLPILALIVIASVSLVVVRLAATALMLTGLSWDAASFQAYSAFFGVGFTTSEAELVVNHPVRRRIIRHLILAGNIGLTGALGAVVVTFVNTRSTVDAFGAFATIAIGGAALALLATRPTVKELADRLIRFTLVRSGVAHVKDYALLLRVESGYVVSEIEVPEGHALAGRTLGESRPDTAGVVVLGVLRGDGSYLGTPTRDTPVAAGDVLTVYGLENDVEQLTRSAPSG